MALHCEIVSIQLDIVPDTFPVSFSDLQKTNALWHAACFVLQVVLKSKTVEKIIQTDKIDDIVYVTYREITQETELIKLTRNFPNWDY